MPRIPILETLEGDRAYNIAATLDYVRCSA